MVLKVMFHEMSSLRNSVLFQIVDTKNERNLPQRKTIFRYKHCPFSLILSATREFKCPILCCESENGKKITACRLNLNLAGDSEWRGPPDLECVIVTNCSSCFLIVFTHFWRRNSTVKLQIMFDKKKINAVRGLTLGLVSTTSKN